MTTLIRRFLAALALDPRVFEEVEANRGATGQALVVVLLAAVGAGSATPASAARRARCSSRSRLARCSPGRRGPC